MEKSDEQGIPGSPFCLAHNIYTLSINQSSPLYEDDCMLLIRGQPLIVWGYGVMQPDVGNEPYLFTAQAPCLFINCAFYYKSIASWQRITAVAKSGDSDS